MQVVSDAWKAAHTERLLDENFLEVTIEIGDPESMQDGQASDNGADELSNTAGIARGVSITPPKYALLDWNSWTLDGTYKMLPDDHPDETGFIGNAICGDDGIFATPPVISIIFPKTFERPIPGITITWSPEYDEYPRSFRIEAYDGDRLVSQANVTDNNSTVSPVSFDIDSYSRMVITIYDWCLPLHRARVADVFIGLKKSYKKNDIVSYNNNVSISPLSDRLPKYEINFDVSNVSGEYDPNNPNSLTRYLMERQAVGVRYGMLVKGKAEYIDGGRYYLNEWTAPQNGITAQFKARDVLEYMQGTYYRGKYNPAGVTLYELAESVLTDADLPLIRGGVNPWELDESLKIIKTTAALPMCTIAECLQLIANAARCVLTFDRTGKIRITRMQTAPVDYTVSAFNSYRRPELKLSKQLKSVEVDVFSYYAGNTGVKIYEGTIPVSGTQTVVLEYAESAADVSASVGGGELVSAAYYTNACELEIRASGNVSITVTGTQLKSSPSTLTLHVGGDGETEHLSNPLVTASEDAAEIAEFIRSVLTNRRTFEMEWRSDTRLDAGDVIHIDNKYGSETAYVTKLKYHFTGGFRADGEARATT